MESKDKIMLSDLADKIGKETERTNKLRNDGMPISAAGVSALSLEQYRAAFEELGEAVLPEELLEKTLAELKKELYKLKTFYPEGAKLLLAAFPCDQNGRIYSSDEIRNGVYFKILLIDPRTGLSAGYGPWGESSHALLLPQEIQDACCFDVHYDSSTPWADESDFERFSAAFSTAYRNLQRLLK